MKKNEKLVTILFVLLVFICQILASESNKIIYYEETKNKFVEIDKSKIPEILKENFPDVKFVIDRRWEAGIEKPNNDIVAVYKGKKYWLRQFNRLWLDAAKDKEDINGMIKCFINLFYWKDTFHIRYKKLGLVKNSKGEAELKEILPKYNKIEVSNFRKVFEKFNKLDNVKEEIYRISIKVNSKFYFYKIWMRKNQIYRIEIKDNGNLYDSMMLKIYSCNYFREINIKLVSGVYDSLFINNKNHYYIKVDSNNIETHNFIRINVSGLPANEQRAKINIKPLYGYSDSLWKSDSLDVNNEGVANYDYYPSNNTNTGFATLYITIGSDTTFWENNYIIPEHVKHGTFNNGYDYEIHYCNQFFAGHNPTSQFPPHPSGIEHAETFAEYVENALIESWNKQVIEWELAKGCNSNGFTDVLIDDENLNIFSKLI